MTMFKDVNRIIFDLDNTIFKHYPEKEADKIVEILGIKEKEEFKKQLSVLFSENMERYKWAYMTKENYEYILESRVPLLRSNGKDIDDFFDALINANVITLMEGAKELLEYLYNKGYEIVALTNWFYEHQVKTLKRLDVLQYFEKIYSWDTYYPKPNRLAVLRALESTDPKSNVSIGDDPFGDITIAKMCGLKTIGFNIDYSKYGKKCPKIQRADVNISSLIEIKKYL